MLSLGFMTDRLKSQNFLTYIGWIRFHDQNVICYYKNRTQSVIEQLSSVEPRVSLLRFSSDG